MKQRMNTLGVLSSLKGWHEALTLRRAPAFMYHNKRNAWLALQLIPGRQTDGLLQRLSHYNAPVRHFNPHIARVPDVMPTFAWAWPPAPRSVMKYYVKRLARPALRQNGGHGPPYD